jgi:predicted RNA-binding protein YlxR (DUF448 family)
MRTCTGCRAVVPQRELVRVAFDGPRLVVDRARRLPGRGAYVHPAAGCVTVAGLSRSLKKGVAKGDMERIVSDLSRADDNSKEPDEDRDHLGKNAPGLAGADAVETPPRLTAKDDRNKDARV